MMVDAATIRDGINNAAPEDRRDLYRLLQIRCALHADPDGVKLGRKNSYCVDWTAAIHLLDGASRLRNPVMQ